jgi:branched-chain amino acid transport system substrate-binding protein
MSGKGWKIGIVAGVIIALAVLFTFGRELLQRSGGGAETVVVGHVAPLTGDAAVFGVWEREGIELAVDEINAGGGINGKRLVVEHEDDQGEPTMAVSALQNLVTTRQVKAVIGGTLSGTTLAMAPVAMRNHIVLVSPSAQSPRIAEAGDYIFRLFVPTTIEGSFLANLANRSTGRTAAILFLNNDYGVGLQEAVTAGLSKNIRVLAAEAYQGDARDFRAQIQRATAAGRPDMLFVLGYQTDVATIVKQLRELGVHAQIFAPNSFEGDDTLKIAGSAAEGVIYDYPVLPGSDLTARVQAAFQQRYGRSMNVYNGVGYDATMLIAAAMRKGGSFDGTALRDAIRQLRDFPGVTGPITFGGGVDVVSRPLEARIYKGGRFERLQ